MENYYTQFYKAPKPSISEDLSPNTALKQRLEALLNTALKVAEDHFGMKAKGTTIERCRRLEQAGWDRIFRDELKPGQTLSAIERGLADRIAEEASLRMWHMRLVENFVAVTGRYVLENPTAERFAETTLLIRDTIMQFQGESPFPRPSLGLQTAIVTVGDPISVTDRWAEYKASRREAVVNLTQDLQTALESLIISSHSSSLKE